MEFNLNKVFKWFGVATIVFIVGGFVFGSFVASGSKTMKACHCEVGLLEERSDQGFDNVSEALKNTSDMYHEYSCNRVDKTEFRFFTGIVNVYQEKSGYQVLECRGSEKIGSHTEYDNVEPTKLYIWLLGDFKI